MADTLLIHYSPEKPDKTVWSIVNNDGELTTKISSGSLIDAANFAAGKKVVMLLDSNFMNISRVKLPTKNKQKLLHAIPYALEEQLADEIEDLHFVIASNKTDDHTAVACVAKTQLDDIIRDCAEAGFTLDAILADALCLMANDRQWAILLYDDTVYIHQNSLSAICIERDLYKDLLDHLLSSEKSVAPEKLLLLQLEGSSYDNIEHEKLAQTEIIPVTYNEHPLVIFSGHYKNAMPLNLLQQEYKPVSKGNINIKRWRLAASLAALWLVLHLSYLGYQNHQLDISNQELRSQIIATYKASFPDSKKFNNVRFQMETKLDELRSGNRGGNIDLISLLKDSHHAFTNTKDIIIKEISFRNNHMDFTITSTNLKSVELINKKLNTATLKSEIISSSSENNTVKGSIRIQRPNS